MKKTVLFLGAVICTLSVSAAQHIITNSGFTFSPADITINEGDEVLFQLASIHVVQEVSQSTWNANDNTALSGGFSTPSGGGSVFPTVGQHYYVCVPHASMGMKGKILVLDNLGIKAYFKQELSVFPNPATNMLNIETTSAVKSYTLSNTLGQQVMSGTQSATEVVGLSLPVADLPRGMYLLTISDGTAERTKRVVLQ